MAGRGRFHGGAADERRSFEAAARVVARWGVARFHAARRGNDLFVCPVGRWNEREAVDHAQRAGIRRRLVAGWKAAGVLLRQDRAEPGRYGCLYERSGGRGLSPGGAYE